MTSFLRVGSLTSNKPFDNGADSDCNLDPGSFRRNFFTMRDRGNCRNSAGSAALAHVCGLQVLLVYK